VTARFVAGPPEGEVAVPAVVPALAGSRPLTTITPAPADALEEMLRAWPADIEVPVAGCGLVG
jgi:hypothetical protein